MWQYLARRLILMVPTLLLVTLVVFVAIRILPTDTADLITSNAPVGGLPLPRMPSGTS